MTNTLIELFETAGKNDFEFTYKTSEGDNILNLDLKNKKVNLTIGNPEDKDFDTTLRDAIMTIKGGS